MRWILFLVLMLGPAAESLAQRKAQAVESYRYHEREAVRAWREYQQERAKAETFARIRIIRARARDIESYHVSGTRREATEWVESLSADELSALLEGSAGSPAGSVKFRSEVEFDEARGAYVERLQYLIDAYNTDLIAALPSSDRSLLDVYLDRQLGPRRPRPEPTPLQIDAWRESLWAEHQRLKKDFRNLFKSLDSKLRSIEGVDFSRSRASEHEQQYRSAAFLQALRESRVLSALRWERWRFEAGSDKDFWRMLKALEQPLPGGRPELVYFMDSLVSVAEISTLNAAWSAHGRARVLDHVDIDRFLSEFEGRTVILVGHMQDQRLVVQPRPGAEPLSVNIPSLLLHAARRNVLLIPVGCKSADEGSYFGFTRPIYASEVSRFLRAIPKQDMAVGELIDALGEIGDITLHLGRTADYLESTVIGRGGESMPAEAISVVRLPKALPTAPAPSFDDYLADWEHQHRPLLDSGVFGWLRSVLREKPVWLLPSALAAFALRSAIVALRRRTFERTKLLGKVEDALLRTLKYLGWLMLVSGFIALIWRHREPLGQLLIPALWLLGGCAVVGAILNFVDPRGRLS